MYEIAWRYGLDFRDLIEHNRIKKPYAVKEGQVLYLRSEKLTKHAKSSPKQTLLRPKKQQVFSSNLKWIMPTRGKIIHYYSATQKGINIKGVLGQPIYATADGKIVYCGHGLHGYGNLIIIKHNNIYFSAYAHNRKVFVKEGDLVRQQQKIAEMGKTGTNTVMLHFEIRRAGKPIDPLHVLHL